MVGPQNPVKVQVARDGACYRRYFIVNLRLCISSDFTTLKTKIVEHFKGYRLVSILLNLNKNFNYFYYVESADSLNFSRPQSPFLLINSLKRNNRSQIYVN